AAFSVGGRGAAENALALAVIAHAARLEDAAAAEGGQRRRQIGVAVDGAEIRRRQADRIDEALLRQPVLADLQRARRRKDRHDLLKRLGGADRYVLELVGDHVAAPRQFGQRRRIVIGGDD